LRYIKIWEKCRKKGKKGNEILRRDIIFLSFILVFRKKVLLLHKQKVRPEKCGFIIKVHPEKCDFITKVHPEKCR